jgi:hypothetical protein
MTYLHTALFIIHLVFGSAALILFWVPLFTKKGQLNHVKFGRIYKFAMYVVAIGGFVMSALVISMPQVIKADMIAQSSNPERMVEVIRIFWAYLLYLSILSFTVTRHAVAVIHCKEDRKKLRRFGYLGPIIALLLGAPLMIYFGISGGRTLHLIFGILGLLLAVSMLRYCLKAKVARRQWVLEHIGSFIGSGIGAYTAFLAFGGRTLFEGLGYWQLVFWIAPGVVGSIASAILCRKYAKIFQVTSEDVGAKPAGA